MRLKLERFGLPNKPSETPEQLEEPVRCGDWGRGLRPPSHCPLPQGDNPSVRCGGQLPLHRGAGEVRSAIRISLYKTRF